MTAGTPLKPKPASKPIALATAKEALDRAIDDARRNPETAQALFNFATYGRTDPPASNSVRDTMAELGVPTEFLSYTEPAKYRFS